MPEFQITMPGDVKEIIETIENAGFEAFAVGGCVRDSALGRKPADWDITTSARPEQVKALFKRTIDTGIQHGTVTIMKGNEGYEVTTYRIDGEYEDGRHPKSVEFSDNLIEDLKRRDFTINAMAYNERRGLVDEFDGCKDLEEGVIRAVGNPTERFTEDALRMMRAIRFSAQLGFEIEDDTYQAILALSENINKVSAERVQVELNKTLLSPHPDYVQEYENTGLFIDYLPVIDRVLGDRRAAKVKILLKKVPKTLVMRYAALLKIATADEAKETLRALKLDNKTIKEATWLVEHAGDKIAELESDVRAAIHSYGRENFERLFLFEEALIQTAEETLQIPMKERRAHYSNIRRMYDRITERGDCTDLKTLAIGGNDLMELGVTGKQIGVTLNNLLEAVLENPDLNDKEVLKNMIRGTKL